MVRRGLESNYLTTPVFLNYDLSNDFEVVMNLLDEKFDKPDYYAAGISMGANLLNRYV